MPSAAIRARLRPWLPALALGLSAFIFVTTELLPVGLLPDIAASLGKTEASTGLLLTAYAWSVALMSLPLTALTVRLDRRVLVFALLAVFICGNLFAARASSFAALLGARLCIAMGHAVFWSIVPPLAVRVTPPGGRARALGIIVTCSSLATVAGVPLGTLLGHHMGWRFAFAAVAAVAACIAVVLWRILPPVPSANTGSFRSIPALARNSALRRLYVLTLLTVSGYFTLLTYFSPVMRHTGGFSATDVAVLLLVLGCSGIAGSMAGSRYAERPGRRLLAVPLAAMAGMLFAMPPVLQAGFVGAALFCFSWGLLFTFLSMVFQLRVLAGAADATDVATAVYSGTFNIGIGGGAFIGSWVFAGFGIGYVHYAAGVFFLAGALWAWFQAGGTQRRA